MGIHIHTPHTSLHIFFSHTHVHIFSQHLNTLHPATHPPIPSHILPPPPTHPPSPSHPTLPLALYHHHASMQEFQQDRQKRKGSGSSGDGPINDFSPDLMLLGA